MEDKKRILIVDDEDKFSKVLKMYLEKAGSYEVYVERAGIRAASTARACKPHLILLDIMMPDADGGTVAAEISRDKGLAKTRIVFFTSAVTKEEVESDHGMVSGYPCVSKTSSFKDLLQQIERYLAA